MLLTKAEMARRLREASLKPSTKPIVGDSEHTTNLPVRKKRNVEGRPPEGAFDLDDHFSHQQGSSRAQASHNEANPSFEMNVSSWPELLNAFDHVAHRLLKQDKEK